MAYRRTTSSYIIAASLVLILAMCVASFSPSRTHRLHKLSRRSHSPAPLQIHESHTEEDIGEEALDTPMYFDEENLRTELADEGVTKIIVDEEQDDSEEDSGSEDEEWVEDTMPQEGSENFHKDEKYNENYPKKFDEKNEKRKTKQMKNDKRQQFESLLTTTVTQESDFEETTETTTEISLTNPHSTHFKTTSEKKDNPLALPVTTEGKTNTKQKTEDPLKVYGFPKELLPIMPGGGSRFEDVEKEKLERKKMSQTKGVDDDSAENSSSHDAEGLYSSASLSSFSLCFYCLVSFLHLDRIIL